jgi:hypothetical protein
MAADDNALYWGADTRILRWAPTQQGPVVVAKAGETIASLALNADYVAWMTQAGIYAIPRSTDDAGTLKPVDGGETPTGFPARAVTVAEGAAYYTNRTTLGRLDLASSSVTACSLGLAPTLPAFDGRNLVLFGQYDGGVGLYARPTGPCQPLDTLLDGGLQDPFALVGDTRGQYWIDRRGAIARSDATGTVTVIVDALCQPAALALSGSFLYIATTSRILRFDPTNHALAELARGQHSPTAIAATSNAVYWATKDDATIWRANVQ